MRIEFHVDGFPPRNHRAMSMWGLEDQAPRVRLLRTQAHQAREIVGMAGPIQGDATLRLTVFAPKSVLWLRGDLDSLLAGVCDALQAAPANAVPHALFASIEHQSVSPKLPILIHDDSQLVEISARSQLIPEGQKPYYTVVVESDTATTAG